MLMLLCDLCHVARERGARLCVDQHVCACAHCVCVRARYVFVCVRVLCGLCVGVGGLFLMWEWWRVRVCVCAVSAVCARGSVACALESAVCAVCVTCVVCSWRCVGGDCAIDARAGRWCW